jgi:hypothetical protein
MLSVTFKLTMLSVLTPIECQPRTEKLSSAFRNDQNDLIPEKNQHTKRIQLRSEELLFGFNLIKLFSLSLMIQTNKQECLSSVHTVFLVYERGKQSELHTRKY